RLVGDGISVIIIQDLLVKRQYQNHGIGSKLLGEVLSQFDHTMQIVCMTDDQESTKSFYKKHDLKPVTKYNIVGMANIKSHI
ncbi:N-acetyltransferase, partial [Pseudomonas aeruginosa]